jgi:hypothetical protein
MVAWETPNRTPSRASDSPATYSFTTSPVCSSVRPWRRMVMSCSRSTVATRFGDAVAIADLPGGLAGLIAVHHVGDVIAAQMAFGARFSDILPGQKWSGW